MEYCRMYRQFTELLKEPDDMTAEEKARLKRIKSHPKIVVDLCQKRIDELRSGVMALEAEMDALIDFLNGEEQSK